MKPPPKPPSRAWAPALAIKKPTIDPYENKPRANPRADPDNISYFKPGGYDEEEEMRGTWTTIDPETGKRNWDSAFRSQAGSDLSSTKSQSNAGESLASNSWLQTQVRSTTLEPTWVSTSAKSSAAAESASSAIFVDEDTGVLMWDDSMEASSSALSGSKQDLSSIDLDPVIERVFIDKFTNISDIMYEDNQPLTLFEKRNKDIMPVVAPKRIKNIIGDVVVSTVEMKIDDRAKYRDQFGNYIDGIDRGKMKKRFEDEWQKRLTNRAAEIQLLLKMKAKWDAQTAEEKALQLERREANAKLLNRLGAGLGTDEGLYEFDEMPEIYTRTSRWEIASKASSTATSTISEASFDRFAAQSENRGQRNPYGHQRDSFTRSQPSSTQRPYNRGMRFPNDRRSSSNILSSESDTSYDIAFEDSATDTTPRYRQPIGGSRDSSTSTERPLKRPRDRVPLPRPSPSISANRSNQSFRTKSSSNIAPRDSRASSVTQTTAKDSYVTATVDDEFYTPVKYTPMTAIPQDVSNVQINIDDDEIVEKYDALIERCSNKPRIVQVTLHKSVAYSADAVCAHLFGGLVQEIQFLPADRTAIVFFVDPEDAAILVEHVKTLRERDGHEFRRLQIWADWYGGKEEEAITDAQKMIVASVLGNHASRVLLIHGISLKRKLQEFTDDFKRAFPNKIIIKV
jgi:hypothetical protein